MAHDASSITSGSVRAMPFNTPTRPPPSARVRPNSTSGSGLRGNRSMSRASTRSARSTATVTEELYVSVALCVTASTQEACVFTLVTHLLAGTNNWRQRLTLCPTRWSWRSDK